MKTLIKMKLQLLFMLLAAYSYAQVGIGTETPDPSAILELKSDDKSLLLTRLDNESSITNPVDGMVYYDKDLNCFRGRANGGWVNLDDCGSGGDGGSTAFPWETDVRFTQLSTHGSGGYETYAVSTDNNLYAWGRDFYSYKSKFGEVGSRVQSPAIRSPKFLDFTDFNGKVKKVGIYNFGYIVLTTDGKLYAWGNNGVVPSGVGTRASNGTAIPQLVPDPDGGDWTYLSDANSNGVSGFVMLNDSGEAYVYGGAVGNVNITSGTPLKVAKPTSAPSVKYIKSWRLSAQSYIYLYGDNNKLYVTGMLSDENKGNIGTSSGAKDFRNASQIYEVNLPSGVNSVEKIIGGVGIYNMLLDSNGEVYAWGKGLRNSGNCYHFKPESGYTTSTVIEPVKVEAIGSGITVLDIAYNSTTYNLTLYVGSDNKVYHRQCVDPETVGALFYASPDAIADPNFSSFLETRNQTVLTSKDYFDLNLNLNGVTKVFATVDQGYMFIEADGRIMSYNRYNINQIHGLDRGMTGNNIIYYPLPLLSSDFDINNNP